MSVAENRKKWVEALRSGKYKQGKYGLRSKDDCWCCLGVGADVMGCTWRQVNPMWQTASVGGFYDVNVLPVPLVAEFGLDYVAQVVLVKMNDSEGKDFNQIADYIESLPLE